VARRKLIEILTQHFRVEEVISKAAYFIPVSCCAYSSILKMEAICSSESLMTIEGQHRIMYQEQNSLQVVGCGNEKVRKILSEWNVLQR
jgi:hypothetical protein